MVDIYIRRPQKNSRYSANNIEETDKLELFLQEIEMVLGTPPTSVLGKTDFGVGLSSYLHSFNVGESDLKNAIQQQITRNCYLSGEFSHNISVEFFKTGTSDSAIVEILVEDDNLVRLIVK
jgi:hypothetical protein